MKRFLFISGLFLFLGILATIITFMMISRYKTEVSPLAEEVLDTPAPGDAEFTAPELPPAIEVMMGDNGGVPLKDVPLTETQEKVLSAVNIDTDTFVITETKVTCAVEKIGEERVLAIMAGDAPSVIEVAKLTPCLGQ